MGSTSAKFDPEMEDKDGQNPIQTAEIFAAADARDRARTSAISARECFRISRFSFNTIRANSSQFGYR